MAGVRGDRVLIRCAELAGEAGIDPAAVVLRARDPLELVRAVPRELERHDRRAGVLVDVRSDARLDEILPGQLRRPARMLRARWEVLEQVPVRAARRGSARLDAGQPDTRYGAPHRLGVHGHLQHHGVRGLLPAFVGRQQLLDRWSRPLHDRLGVLGVEQVVRLRRALIRAALHRFEQLVERRQRSRLLVRAHARRREARLEVEDLEPAGRAEGLREVGGRVATPVLDHDLVSVDADLWRGDAKRVDAVLDDLLRCSHAGGGDLLALRRNGAQNDRAIPPRGGAAPDDEEQHERERQQRPCRTEQLSGHQRLLGAES